MLLIIACIRGASRGAKGKFKNSSSLGIDLFAGCWCLTLGHQLADVALTVTGCGNDRRAENLGSVPLHNSAGRLQTGVVALRDCACGARDYLEIVVGRNLAADESGMLLLSLRLTDGWCKQAWNAHCPRGEGNARDEELRCRP
jgi:hypothetical protein